MKYSYQCNCGTNFEKNMSLKDYKETMPCPNCGEMAKRDPKDFAGGYVAKCDGFYGKES